MVNHSCDGFGPYQYCLNARAVFAIPVAPSDVSEREAIVEAEDWESTRFAGIWPRLGSRAVFSIFSQVPVVNFKELDASINATVLGG